jgi:hypothetical protein
MVPKGIALLSADHDCITSEVAGKRYKTKPLGLVWVVAVAVFVDVKKIAS